MNGNGSNIKSLTLLGYAVLAMPLAFAGLPIYIHAPDLYATTYAVPLAHLANALIILRLLDAILDPIIGIYSDRYSHYRSLIIMSATILLSAGVFMVFMQPHFNAIYWFAIAVFLATAGYSILSINYNTIGALLSGDSKQRTRITTTREACGLVGLLLASILPAILKSKYPNEEVFAIFSYIFLVLMLIGYVIYHLSSKRFRLINTPHNNLPIDFFSILEVVKDYRKFFAIFAISTFASSIPSVLVLFFIRDLLDLESYGGLFLFSYFITGALSMPLWRFLASKYGKIESWLISMCLAVIVFIWAFTLNQGDLYQYLTICLLSGVALGAELSLPPSMLADITDANDNLRTTGFAILAFIIKFCLAASSGTILYVLSLAAFQPGMENSTYALYWLSFNYALLPCIIKLVAILLIIYWRNEKIFKTPH